MYSILLTQLGLFTIYTNVCFIVLAKNESLTIHMPISVTSFVISALPKLYAYSLILLLMCTCIREEDRRRKLSYRALTLNDFRM